MQAVRLRIHRVFLRTKLFARRVKNKLLYIFRRHLKTAPNPETSGWKSYLQRALYFAMNAETTVLSLDQPFDICIASDNITVLAGRYVSEATGSAFLYDAIELPPLSTRAGNAYRAWNKYQLDLVTEHEKSIIQKCDGVITIGPSIKKWLQENYDTKNVEVVRNCRNYEEIPGTKTIRQDCNLKDHDKLVLFINGVYPDQGVEQLLEALQQLPETVHAATLGPLAKGDYHQVIRDMAARLGVADRFHILKEKTWNQMLPYAAGADIGVIPRQPGHLNNTLSLPNRIFELIMARLPVASTSLPDIADIVLRHEIGQVFDAQTPKDMADKITSVLENHKTYKPNIEKAAQDLCWENEKQKFLNFVESFRPGKRPLNICFLSRKVIAKNNRIARLSRTLTEAGHNMTILAPHPPGEIQRDRLATYIIVPDNSEIREQAEIFYPDIEKAPPEKEVCAA